MNFFKFLNFPLKSTEISIGLRFQLASVTINFTDNRDYRAVLYSMAQSTEQIKEHSQHDVIMKHACINHHACILVCMWFELITTCLIISHRPNPLSTVIMPRTRTKGTQG